MNNKKYDLYFTRQPCYNWSRGDPLDNLKKLRESVGLSQQALANKLGSTQQKIYSYENGIYEPDITTLKQFAEFFNTSVDYLIGNTDISNKIEKVEKFQLNEEEADILTKYRSLSARGRKSFGLILASLIED